MCFQNLLSQERRERVQPWYNNKELSDLVLPEEFLFILLYGVVASTAQCLVYGFTNRHAISSTKLAGCRTVTGGPTGDAGVTGTSTLSG